MNETRRIAHFKQHKNHNDCTERKLHNDMIVTKNMKQPQCNTQRTLSGLRSLVK